ncbi:hypothetical protein L484_010101 [Morus notabilis]|uniref:Starch synthase catalytic domain-containing protein n=1 Tax=Morus notabilis TaxID=981085 RepID=W9SJ31_9ROSA|nr:hypothetical protein L484_010101 [Morus notabilis]
MALHNYIRKHHKRDLHFQRVEDNLDDFVYEENQPDDNNVEENEALLSLEMDEVRDHIAVTSCGHRVMVVSPRYLNGTAADKKFASVVDMESRIKVPYFGGEQEVAFFHEYREGVDWVFVDHPAYHRPGNPYGDSYGAFGDNQECLLLKL